MIILIIRTIILYFFVLLTIRLMGKRQIGELQPFELVITVMISQLATMPMEDVKMPITHAFTAIIILLILEIITSMLQLKSEKARILMCGKPSILIEKGKINVGELRYQKVNLNDLLEELRLNGYYNLEDVEYAILETCGEISIIPKTASSNATKSDLNIITNQDKLPITLILDGKINYSNLKVANKNIYWLNNQLKLNNIKSPNDVFIAILNSKEKFYYQLKERKTTKK